MSTKKRVSRAVALLLNMAEQSLVKSMTAARLHSLRRKTASVSVEEVLAEIEENRAASLGLIQNAPGGTYPLSLEWMVDRFAEISDTTASIDIQRVADFIDRRKPLDGVLYSKLDQLLDRIDRSMSGVLACCKTYRDDLDALDATVDAIVADIAKSARAMRRTIAVLKVPTLRWMLIDTSPLLLITGAVVVFCAGYLLTTFGAHPPAQLPDVGMRVSSDLEELRKIWRIPTQSLWTHLRDTTAFLGQVTTLAPLALGVAGVLLYPLRRFVFDSTKTNATIESWQTSLFAAAKRLQVSKRAIINIKELNVGSQKVEVTNSPGAIVNMARYMDNVVNTVTQNVKAAPQGPDVKALVEELAAKLKEIAPKIDADKAQEMGANVETLSKEMTLPKPRRAWYELSMSGLKEAAEAIGQVGKPIIDIVAKLSPLLLG